MDKPLILLDLGNTGHVLWSDMAASPSSNSERFAIVSKEERDLLLKDAVPDSTRTATAFWIRTFEEFCSSTGVSCKLETVDEDTLSDVLERFYCGLRKKDGGEYKRSGYIAARCAIQRYLDSLELSIP